MKSAECLQMWEEEIVDKEWSAGGFLYLAVSKSLGRNECMSKGIEQPKIFLFSKCKLCHLEF